MYSLAEKGRRREKKEDTPLPLRKRKGGKKKRTVTAKEEQCSPLACVQQPWKKGSLVLSSLPEWKKG